MKKNLTVLFFVILMAVGILVAAYPFISNRIMSRNLDSEVKNYLNSTAKSDSDEYEEEFKRAEEYNKSLIGSVSIGDPFGKDNFENEEYYNLLIVEGTSVMACVEIPAINIKYPVYHGTDDKDMKNGIGHLSSTSLPVGGKGTHAVLTGHTGLSAAKLFTDIDKLETGDIFYIYVLNRKLAYCVDQIKVVEPSDTSLLQVDTEEDYVTLVTCTPFGSNTHRLLVRGKRISEEEAPRTDPSSRVVRSTWNDEYKFAVLVGLLVMTGILILFIIVKILFHFYRKRKDNA